MLYLDQLKQSSQVYTNRPLCCILMSLGVQYGELGQTNLTHTSTSSTNADQNQGINTLRHLSPLARIDTNPCANPLAWQYDKYYHPNQKNEQMKTKKRKEKNRWLIRTIKPPKAPRHRKNNGKKSRWQIITSVIQFGGPTRDSGLPLPLFLDFSSWIFGMFPHQPISY